MQTMHMLNGGHMNGASRSPIVQAARAGQPMRQAVRNAEATAALQLRQHDDHLAALEYIYMVFGHASIE